MKICSHVITHDTGLAPNPFHGYCTSALCTPSHRRAKLGKGDWLIGNSQKQDGHRLVYAMRISEVLDMNTYFYDARFRHKKPKPEGTKTEQCGDNIYYRQSDSRWLRIPSRFHNELGNFIKDIGKDSAGRPVFVSEHFYYFGDSRVVIPHQFADIIKKGQNTKSTTGRLADDFVIWLETNHRPGVLGTPRDMSDRRNQRGQMITSGCADGIQPASTGPQMSPSPAGTPSQGRGCR
jgi:hypothetical protein